MWKAVHGNVQALLEAGVLSRTRDGKTEFPFETVKVEFMLGAAWSREIALGMVITKWCLVLPGTWRFRVPFRK